jgi:hypothetical protein
MHISWGDGGERHNFDPIGEVIDGFHHVNVSLFGHWERLERVHSQAEKGQVMSIFVIVDTCMHVGGFAIFQYSHTSL